MTEYIENTIDEKIFTQLRKLRAYQREKLSNQLLTEHQEGLSDALESINEIIKVTEAKYNDAYMKHCDIRDRSFVSKTKKQDAYKLYTDLSSELYKSKDKKDTIQKAFIATSRKTIKLNEFDIETEQMILAHLCEIQLICGNKKALPMLEE